MQIINLVIEGFRSFSRQEWSPGRLNVLIGPNASGKSNLLRILECLNAAASGRLGKYIQQEGGMEPVLWDGRSEQIRLRLKMTPLPPYSDPVTDALTYELELQRLGRSSAFRIAHELLGNFYRVETGETAQPFKLLERDPRRAVVYSMDSRRFEHIPTSAITTTTTTPYPTEGSEEIVASDSSLPEDETLLSFASGPFAVNHFVARFEQEIAAWKIHQNFHTHREADIRAPQVTRSESQVDGDGQNLISVLHTLYTGNREFKREINTAMRSAFGDDFEALEFPPAADQRIQLRIAWRSLTQARPAADLSDGTLRFLFLLTVLGNPEPPPLIAIDEPETGLHPSMLPIVAEFARDASLRSQVIMTTHSADFLDSFGDETPTTTVVERTPDGTQLRVLADDELSYWLEQYTLGELFRSNELETMR